MTSQDLLDLYDIKRFLQMRKLLDEPKDNEDNEGTEDTIGFLISAFIDRAEEETQGFIITSLIDQTTKETQT